MKPNLIMKNLRETGTNAYLKDDGHDDVMKGLLNRLRHYARYRRLTKRFWGFVMP